MVRVRAYPAREASAAEGPESDAIADRRELTRRAFVYAPVIFLKCSSALGSSGLRSGWRSFAAIDMAHVSSNAHTSMIRSARTELSVGLLHLLDAGASTQTQRSERVVIDHFLFSLHNSSIRYGKFRIPCAKSRQICTMNSYSAYNSYNILPNAAAGGPSLVKGASAAASAV